MSLFCVSDSAPTETFTLSLHDALPISDSPSRAARCPSRSPAGGEPRSGDPSRAKHLLQEREGALLKEVDRKSTRLNSSHLGISYAVFCLKKKKRNTPTDH